MRTHAATGQAIERIAAVFQPDGALGTWHTSRRSLVGQRHLCERYGSRLTGTLRLWRPGRDYSWVGQTAFRKAACGVRTLEQNENTPSAESASAGPPPWLVNGGPAQTHRLADGAAQSATDLVKRQHRRGQGRRTGTLRAMNRRAIPLPVKSDSFNAQPGTDRRLVRQLSLLLCPGKPAPPAGR